MVSFFKGKFLDTETAQCGIFPDRATCERERDGAREEIFRRRVRYYPDILHIYRDIVHRKPLTHLHSPWYDTRASEQKAFFLCLKIQRKESIGGGSHARKSNIGMYRVQAAELYYYKREEEPSGEDGDQQILQVLQEAHTAQRDKVSF